MCKITNRKLVQNNILVGSIHDRLLKENIDIGDAFTDACVWIAELKLQLEKLETKVSSGYTRTDTSHLKWNPKRTVAPVDGGDAWIRTGVSDGG